MRFDVAASTRKGTRPINQDAVYAVCRGGSALLVVADGMGGHSYGELASAAIVDAVRTVWEDVHIAAWTTGNQPKITERIDYSMEGGRDIISDRVAQPYAKAIASVNDELYKKYASHGEIVGATVVLLAMEGERYELLSLGDSHAYSAFGKRMETMSEDDVWENQPDVRYQYSETQIRLDQRFGKLIAAIGPLAHIELHRYCGVVRKGNVFMLCSDGIYKYCPKHQIERIVCANGLGQSAARKVNRLMRCAEKNSTEDNYTVCVCRCLG